MAEIRRLSFRNWENHHETVRRRDVDQRALVAGPAAGAEPAMFLKAMADAVSGLLLEARDSGATLQVIGSGWSFSDLVDGDGILLHTHGAPAVFDMRVSSAPAGRFVLVSGGTTIATLNEFLKKEGLSLETSGAHDGQTVAGACATSVHGSRVGYGAFQNHVRGIHLLTGPGDSIWIEEGADPVVGRDFLGALGARFVGDRQVFDAALVHLGGMGYVNAYLLEIAERFDLAMVQREQPIGGKALRMLQCGDFIGFARQVWPECDQFFPGQMPAYVEVILNPFADVAPVKPRPRPSIVYLGFDAGPPDAAEHRWYPFVPFRDVVNRMLDRAQDLGDALLPPWMLPEVLLLTEESDPPPGTRPEGKAWGDVFGKVKWRPFDLYNAAFAVKREELEKTISALKKALFASGAAEAGALVFTLRFVTEARGLLAFQRFPETVVVNVDGIRGHRAHLSALRMAAALDAAGIDSSQHWGKQGDLSAARIAREFGPVTSPGTRLADWRKVRNRLMDPDMRLVFTNKGLAAWGIV